MENQIQNVIGEKYLPLGTVVMLKTAKKAVMITGYVPINNETKEMFDYKAVVFPEGDFSSDITAVFNHNQIERVLFEGFKTKDSEEFMTSLKAEVLKLTTENSNVNNNQ